MKKKDLKPGMKVKNKISGNLGEVRGKNGKLIPCASFCVCIRRRTKKGKLLHPIWNLDSLELLQ